MYLGVFILWCLDTVGLPLLVVIGGGGGGAVFVDTPLLPDCIPGGFGAKFGLP